MKKPLTSWQIYLQCRGSHGTRERLFQSIWHQYRKRLMFFIRYFVRDDVEDVFQEVMLKVFQNIEKFNPLYPFRTWIYSIARNHSLNYINKRKLTTVYESLEKEAMFSTSSEDSPEEQTIHKELHATIEGVLAGFTQENRQIAFLRFYEGMKHRDIARIMNIPTGTVKSRLHSVRAVLKEALDYNEA